VVLYVQQMTGPLDELLSWLDEIQVGATSLARVIGIADVPPIRYTVPCAPSTRLISTVVTLGNDAPCAKSSGALIVAASGAATRASGKSSERASTTAPAPPTGKFSCDTATAVPMRSDPAARIGDVRATTVIVPDVPVIDEVTVSVAVTVRLPIVRRVALKFPTPFVSLAFELSDAEVSIEVRCTVPPYDVTVFWKASFAVTATKNDRPTADEVGAVTSRCVVVAGAMVIAAVVPEIPEFAMSVAVTVCGPAVFSVTVNACWPLDNVELAGNTAAESLLVNLTVPA